MNHFATRLALAADILKVVGEAITGITRVIEDYGVQEGMKEIEP